MCFIAAYKTLGILEWLPPFRVGPSEFTSASIKGGYAHFKMYIFHFKFIDLDPEMHFVKLHAEVQSFLFTLHRQKKVCTPGNEAIMKIHEKLFSVVYQ